MDKLKETCDTDFKNIYFSDNKFYNNIAANSKDYNKHIFTSNYNNNILDSKSSNFSHTTTNISSSYIKNVNNKIIIQGKLKNNYLNNNKLIVDNNTDKFDNKSIFLTNNKIHSKNNTEKFYNVNPFSQTSNVSNLIYDNDIIYLNSVVNTEYNDCSNKVNNTFTDNNYIKITKKLAFDDNVVDIRKSNKNYSCYNPRNTINSASNYTYNSLNFKKFENIQNNNEIEKLRHNVDTVDIEIVKKNKELKKLVNILELKNAEVNSKKSKLENINKLNKNNLNIILSIITKLDLNK